MKEFGFIIGFILVAGISTKETKSPDSRNHGVNYFDTGMKTEPNKSLQTISRTVPVAAEPLCGPALEMSDF